jgi:hypothetical protein
MVYYVMQFCVSYTNGVNTSGFVGVKAFLLFVVAIAVTAYFVDKYLSARKRNQSISGM